MYKLVAKDIFQYCRALATSGENHRFGLASFYCLAEILAKDVSVSSGFKLGLLKSLLQN